MNGIQSRIHLQAIISAFFNTAYMYSYGIFAVISCNLNCTVYFAFTLPFDFVVFLLFFFFIEIDSINKQFHKYKR